ADVAGREAPAPPLQPVEAFVQLARGPIETLGIDRPGTAVGALVAGENPFDADHAAHVRAAHDAAGLPGRTGVDGDRLRAGGRCQPHHRDEDEDTPRDPVLPNHHLASLRNRCWPTLVDTRRADGRGTSLVRMAVLRGVNSGNLYRECTWSRHDKS